MSNNLETGRYVPLAEVKAQAIDEQETLRTNGQAVSLPVALARVLITEAHEALTEIDGAISVGNGNIEAIAGDQLMGLKHNIGKVLIENCVITMEDIIWQRVVDLDSFAARYDFAMSGTRFKRIGKEVTGTYPVTDCDWQIFMASVCCDKTYTNVLRNRNVWPNQFRNAIKGLTIYDTNFDQFVGDNVLLLHESLANFVLSDSEQSVAVPKL